MTVPNLIVGGGISGMLVALELARWGEESLIFTDDELSGGLMGCFKHPNFSALFDYGGHVYTTKDKYALELMESVGAIKVEERKAFFSFEKQIPFPVQDNTDIKIAPVPSYNVRTFEDYIIRNFGFEFYQQFMKPFNSRVWSTDPSLMDYDWTDNRVKLANDKKSWGINNSFYHAPGVHIVEALTKQMIATGKIGVVKGRVEYENNEFVWKRPLKANRVFDTVGISLSGRPRTNVVTCIGLIFDEDPLPGFDFHWAYPDFHSRIHRITRQSSYHPAMSPDGQHTLLLEIPSRAVFSGGPNVDNGILRKKLLLEQAVGQRVPTPVGSVEVTCAGYPVPTFGHRTLIALNKRIKALDNVYYAGRWGSHTYMNLHHLFYDAQSVVLAAMEGVNDDYVYNNHYYPKKLGDNNETA